MGGGGGAGPLPTRPPPSCPAPQAGPTPDVSLAVSAVTSRGSQTEALAPGAGEVSSVTGASFLRRLPHLRRVPGRCRRRRHGVPGHCGECVSERAGQCPARPEPTDLGTELRQAKPLGGVGARGRGGVRGKAGIRRPPASPRREAARSRPPTPQTPAPLLRAPAAGSREGGKQRARDSEA